MMEPVGYAVRDGDGIEVRLGGGARRGWYRVAAGEAPALLAGRAAAALWVSAAPVGIIAPSKDLRVLLGAFRDRRGFTRAAPLSWIGAAAFAIPRAHLAAHYARFDGPVTVYAGKGRQAAPAAGEGDA